MKINKTNIKLMDTYNTENWKNLKAFFSLIP